MGSSCYLLDKLASALKAGRETANKIAEEKKAEAQAKHRGGLGDVW